MFYNPLDETLLTYRRYEMTHTLQTRRVFVASDDPKVSRREERCILMYVQCTLYILNSREISKGQSQREILLPSCLDFGLLLGLTGPRSLVTIRAR